MRIPPSPTGMIIHAVMTAARRQEGKRRPATRTRTLTAARTQCQRATALIPPIAPASAPAAHQFDKVGPHDHQHRPEERQHARQPECPRAPCHAGLVLGCDLHKTSVLLPARLGHRSALAGLWPHSGAQHCLPGIAVNSVPPGQQAYEPVADVAVSLYGSVRTLGPRRHPLLN